MDLISIRMRAEDRNGHHVCGAEGIYKPNQSSAMVEQFTRRALAHPKGPSDSITITIEKLKQSPLHISSLPVSTIPCTDTEESRAVIKKLLTTRCEISAQAVSRALRMIFNPRINPMRGAALMDAQSGRRLEPDRRRGVRASHLGITPRAQQTLSRRLSPLGIDTTTVREALILASKVASCEGVIAELCVSDNPDYTTGYVASPTLGYVRIMNIKQPGSAGGRVVFLRPHADIPAVMQYLQQTPVLINSIGRIVDGSPL